MTPIQISAIAVVVFTGAAAGLVTTAVETNSPLCYGLAVAFALYAIWMMLISSHEEL